MKKSISMAAFVMTTATAFGEGKTPDWDRVTDKAGWQPRDSQREVVYKDLIILSVKSK